MLTLIIEDKNVENIFLNEFHSNKEKFFEFIKLSFDGFRNESVNEDLSYLEDEIQKGFDSGKSGKKHHEVFRELREKYGIH
jgi:hypothetical protein